MEHAEESSVRRRDFGCITVDSAQQGLKERGVDTLQLKQVKKSSFSALPDNNSDYMGIFSK